MARVEGSTESIRQSDAEGQQGEGSGSQRHEGAGRCEDPGASGGKRTGARDGLG
jgi:hypothetical protein